MFQAQERERERERLVPRKKDQVPVKKSAFRLNKRAPDQPCLFRRNDYTSSYANGDFVVRSSTSAYPLWGRIGFDGDVEAEVAGRGAAGLVKSGTIVIGNDYEYAYAA